MDKIWTMDPVIFSPGKGPGARYSNASWVALIGCAEDAKVAGALTTWGSSVEWMWNGLSLDEHIGIGNWGFMQPPRLSPNGKHVG